MGRQLIDKLVDSDILTATDRERYLGFARNVRAGHQDELEIAGNAFNVKFTCGGVCIESLWDEDMAPVHIELGEFIRMLSAWPAA
ncbi:hypothetical protein [Variovorax boronicumulans]|uniref:hypothetical protein n=1 Tax=Variovorax boronicumulans TaxID=436515 RepID=UPI003391721C